MNELAFSKEQFLEDALRAWEYQVVGDASDILDQLGDNAISAQFSVSERQEIIMKMRWVAFATLPEEDEISLIKNNLSVALYDKTFDLEQAFRLKETATPAVTWIDEVVPKFIDALLKNDEKIGTREFPGTPPLDSPANNPKPSVSNWLKDYAKIYGMDKQDKFVIRQYMTSSAAVQALAPEDKRALERLLLLFESIKVFSIEQILREAERLQVEEEQSKKQSRPAVTPAEENQQAFIRQPMPVPPRNNSSHPPLSPANLQQSGNKSPATPHPGQSDNSLAGTPALNRNLPSGIKAAPVMTPPSPISTPPAPKPEPGPLPKPLSGTKEKPLRSAPTKSFSPKSPEAAPVIERIQSTPSINNNAAPQEPIPAPYLGDLIGYKNIRAALQLNPKVSNQVITSNPLEILGQGSALSPTVQNWILDYRVRFGISGHTKDEREQFLHRSVNGRKLGPDEKNRIAAIIQSYDENTLLPISEKNGEIVFSEIK